jgi:hypothetical protein
LNPQRLHFERRRNLEKQRLGRRERLPTPAETEAILAQASPEFRLTCSALRQCGD